MARKVFFQDDSPEHHIELKETIAQKSVPPPEFGWKKNATFRRFVGIDSKGQEVMIVIWEGHKNG